MGFNRCVSWAHKWLKAVGKWSCLFWWQGGRWIVTSKSFFFSQLRKHMDCFTLWVCSVSTWVCLCWGDFLGLIVLVEKSALACNRKQDVFLLGGFNLGGGGGATGDLYFLCERLWLWSKCLICCWSRRITQAWEMMMNLSYFWIIKEQCTFVGLYSKAITMYYWLNRLYACYFK